MCLLAVHLLQCQNTMSPSGKQTFTFVFLYSIIMAAMVSLGSICSIFPLCVESKALAKSRSNIVAPRFFCTYTSKNSTDSQNL